VSESAAEPRMDRIRSRLATALATQQVELIDDSHRHAGHAGARDGRGHFRVRVVSEKFAGLRSLQRHQLVYQSLGDMMQTDIHALNIVALTPQEAL
jgi:BolA family transcriptional regulator, general stress-responsive regulator